MESGSGRDTEVWSALDCGACSEASLRNLALPDDTTLLLTGPISGYSSPLPRREFPLHLLERVRVRQGEGEKGRANRRHCGEPKLRANGAAGSVAISFLVRAAASAFRRSLSDSLKNG